MKSIYEKLTANSIYVTTFPLARSKTRQDCPLSSFLLNVFVFFILFDGTIKYFSMVCHKVKLVIFFLSSSSFPLPPSLPTFLLATSFQLDFCSRLDYLLSRPAVRLYPLTSLCHSLGIVLVLLFYIPLLRSMPSVTLAYSFVFMEHMLEYLRRLFWIGSNIFENLHFWKYHYFTVVLKELFLSSTGITRKRIRNANSHIPPQTYWIGSSEGAVQQKLALTAGYNACWHLRITILCLYSTNSGPTCKTPCSKSFPFIAFKLLHQCLVASSAATEKSNVILIQLFCVGLFLFLSAIL